MAEDAVCKHIKSVTVIKKAKKHVCEECIKTGDEWVHLRVCQTCGVELCCDDSPNKHMTKHYQHTSHPVITSGQPGEQWMFCYPDQLFVEYD